MKNSNVLTDPISILFEDDTGLFNEITQNYKMEDEIKFVVEYLKIEQTDKHMISNFELLLSWLSSKNIQLNFDYVLPQMITEGYVAKFWRNNDEKWLMNSFNDGSNDQILEFQLVSQNQYVIEHLTPGKRARIKVSDPFEMNDSKNDDFYNTLREDKTFTIECDKILYTDDISMTIEISTAQKIVQLMRFDDCIHQNQLLALKSYVR